MLSNNILTQAPRLDIKRTGLKYNKIERNTRKNCLKGFKFEGPINRFDEDYRPTINCCFRKVKSNAAGIPSLLFFVKQKANEMKKPGRAVPTEHHKA